MHCEKCRKIGHIRPKFLEFKPGYNESQTTKQQETIQDKAP